MNSADKAADTQQLVADLQAVIRDAEALLAATAAHTGAAAEQARARVEDTLRQAKQRLGDLPEDWLANARQAAASTERYVQQHPWQSLGIAAGIGMIIGLLVSRRD